VGAELECDWTCACFFFFGGGGLGFFALMRLCGVGVCGSAGLLFDCDVSFCGVFFGGTRLMLIVCGQGYWIERELVVEEEEWERA
jgi:hypothetical protein